MFTIRDHRLVLRAPDEPGGGAGDGDGDKGEPKGEEQEQQKGTLELTQSELDRRLTSEKEQGRRAAARELAEQLGMTPAEAKKFIEDRKGEEDKKLSEVERREAKAKEQSAEALRAAADNKLSTRRLSVKEALVDAGCRKDRRERAASILLGELDDEARADEIVAKVETLTKELPEFFALPKTGDDDDDEKAEDKGEKRPPATTFRPPGQSTKKVRSAFAEAKARGAGESQDERKYSFQD